MNTYERLKGSQDTIVVSYWGARFHNREEPFIRTVLRYQERGTFKNIHIIKAPKTQSS